ncbi:hypothetical protein M409DRAFT_56399 [Zasmidium cellare ATCC 36951]|uniref:Uncharacterized protein n=1 Tax=Zasmidium cellare ATCC 36951 TaxID=1080233 RepID=A0A6A6CCU2_ZASCE|nr:uncharacterized protein M409DRAFT_56399 [Zasmidium cellare ATCC 36951]KAF2164563.1 hypothetical protein M409DRAFT_56399 [Zasmidium cellare ATCC 36951]
MPLIFRLNNTWTRRVYKFEYETHLRLTSFSFPKHTLLLQSSELTFQTKLVTFDLATSAAGQQAHNFNMGKAPLTNHSNRHAVVINARLYPNGPPNPSTFVRVPRDSYPVPQSAAPPSQRQQVVKASAAPPPRRKSFRTQYPTEPAFLPMVLIRPAPKASYMRVKKWVRDQARVSRGYDALKLAGSSGWQQEGG